ncbi:hypothetical protein KM92DES2_11553 [uncultured Desulfovibrio sp.]|uniref:Uncharacterized protein n=1 Tax=uncultured Desulfovibrio sp. TaxID=167968 RepID=A0A212JQS4_9BACT|nr:hypothetical protein KM92DES2_11553 [uncultured Desulfovibrio sp.]
MIFLFCTMRAIKNQDLKVRMANLDLFYS